MRTLLVSILGLATVLAVAEENKGPTVTGQEVAPPNLIAIHDPSSPDFGRNCLDCHREVLSERSQDPRVAAIHIRMIPYTPGFNPRKGVTNAVCIQCHRSADLREGSAAGLRVQVDRKLCALCHAPAGPGRVLYR